MSTPELTVPTDFADVSPSWMTRVLAAHHPGATVSAVAIDLRDDGTNRRARLRLSYSSGEGPTTVFVKAADPDHKELIRMTSGMFHEPRLFSSGVELPLEHPVVYAALATDPSPHFWCLAVDRRYDANPIRPASGHFGAGTDRRRWRARVPAPFLADDRCANRRNHRLGRAGVVLPSATHEQA